MSRLWAGLAAAALACVLGTVATAAKPAKPEVERSPVLPASVVDAEGKTVVVRDVSRIVPLNGDVAETIVTLGLGKNIVGVDTSATYPPKLVSSLPRIGNQQSLSAEGILSLHPTVVVGTTDAGPPAVIQQLRDAGTTVVIIPKFVDLDAGPKKLRVIGRALGVPKRGNRLAKQVEHQVALAKKEVASVSSRPKVLFLYLRGSQVQFIGGKGSGADTMITAAGGVDAGTAAGISGFKPLTAESLVASSPDVLLLLRAGLDSVGGIDGLLSLPGVAQTPAGKNRRVLAYDDLLLLGLGPREGSALRQLVRGLHPELT
jgi:iron complex transport system substrate-binding protein